MFVNEATTPFNYNNIWDVAFTKWQERERDVCVFFSTRSLPSLYTPSQDNGPLPSFATHFFGVKEALSPVTRSNDVPVLPSPEVSMTAAGLLTALSSILYHPCTASSCTTLFANPIPTFRSCPCICLSPLSLLGLYHLRRRGLVPFGSVFFFFSSFYPPFTDRHRCWPSI